MSPGAALILAGGAGRRLGGVFKPLIDVDGQPIIERQLAVLRPRFGQLLISANDPAPLVRFGLPVIGDPPEHVGAGPLAGIAAALAECRAPYLLVVAGDMPYLSGEAIDLLVSRWRTDVDVVYPDVGGQAEPLHAIYATRLLPVVRDRLARGWRSARRLLNDPRVCAEAIEETLFRSVDPSLRSLTNINSPTDLP